MSEVTALDARRVGAGERLLRRTAAQGSGFAATAASICQRLSGDRSGGSSVVAVAKARCKVVM